MTNQSYTIEEAAHRAAALMEDLVPGMPEQVASAGEAPNRVLKQARRWVEGHRVELLAMWNEFQR